MSEVAETGASTTKDERLAGPTETVMHKLHKAEAVELYLNDAYGEGAGRGVGRSGSGRGGEGPEPTSTPGPRYKTVKVTLQLLRSECVERLL